MNVTINESTIDVTTGDTANNVTISDGDIGVSIGEETINLTTSNVPITVAITTETVNVTINDSDIDVTISESALGGGGVTDHGALTGLSDNDHPQYLLVADLPVAISGGDFTDVPVLTGSGGKFVKVAGDETGFEYATVTPGSGAALDVENTFTAPQSIIVPEPNWTLGSEVLVNGDFATDLTGWVDADSAFGVSPSGGLVRAAGTGDATLTQVVELSGGSYYRLLLNVTGSTTGSISVRVIDAGLFVDQSDTLDIVSVGTSILCVLEIVASDDFNGVATLSLVDCIADRTPIFTVGTETGSEIGVGTLVVNADGHVEIVDLHTNVLRSDGFWIQDMYVTAIATITTIHAVSGVIDSVVSHNTITDDFSTQTFYLDGDIIRIGNTRSPASNDDGRSGEICVDDDYIYRHDGTQWKRIAWSMY